MGDFGCGDGGWTPIMKINGNKVTISPRRKFIEDTEKVDGRKISAVSLVTIKHRSSRLFFPDTKTYVFCFQYNINSTANSLRIQVSFAS